MSESEKNQQVADRICHDFQWNGRQFAIGDCVALLDGEIVAVANSLDEALSHLRAVDPDPNRGMLVEVRSPVVNVVR